MWQAALDLLFPPRCAGCGSPGAWLCVACRQQIAADRGTGPWCELCDRPSPTSPCAICRQTPPIARFMRIVGVYTPPLKTAIHAFKFNGKREVARPLGQLLAARWQAQGAIPLDGVVAVPMPADRQRQRGYNPAAELARVCSRDLRLPFWSTALTRTRAAPPQHGLDAPARRANVTGLFACTSNGQRQVAGKNILLIDDVTTTGATLDAIAGTLYAAGAQHVWALALARPDLRRQQG